MELCYGTFGSGYSADPESIVFDAAGNAYIGQADGERDILKISPKGNLLASLDVNTGPRGSDWVELSADQCTVPLLRGRHRAKVRRMQKRTVTRFWC